MDAEEATEPLKKTFKETVAESSNIDPQQVVEVVLPPETEPLED